MRDSEFVFLFLFLVSCILASFGYFAMLGGFVGGYAAGYFLQHIPRWIS